MILLVVVAAVVVVVLGERKEMAVVVVIDDDVEGIESSRCGCHCSSVYCIRSLVSSFILSFCWKEKRDSSISIVRW